MKLFIAGPMSSRADTDWNFPAFHAAAARLRAGGYDVLDPADRGLIPGWEWADYLRHTIPEMLSCDGVALLPAWVESPGARLEVHVAEAIGMECCSVDWWLADTRRIA